MTAKSDHTRSWSYHLGTFRDQCVAQGRSRINISDLFLISLWLFFNYIFIVMMLKRHNNLFCLFYISIGSFCISSNSFCFFALFSVSEFISFGALLSFFDVFLNLKTYDTISVQAHNWIRAVSLMSSWGWRVLSVSFHRPPCKNVQTYLRNVFSLTQNAALIFTANFTVKLIKLENLSR